MTTIPTSPVLTEAQIEKWRTAIKHQWPGVSEIDSLCDLALQSLNSSAEGEAMSTLPTAAEVAELVENLRQKVLRKFPSARCIKSPGGYCVHRGAFNYRGIIEPVGHRWAPTRADAWWEAAYYAAQSKGRKK